MDAWSGGEGHILALDQRGASLDPTYQGLFDLVIVLILWFGLLVLLSFFRNYLSTSGYIWALHDPGHPLPMQSRILGCLWRRHTSGSVVQNLGINYFRISHRCTNDFRMILRLSLLWWREGEGITTISTRRTLLAALIYEHCKHKERQINFYWFNLSFPITKA